jgi:hypothetical protein
MLALSLLVAALTFGQPMQPMGVTFPYQGVSGAMVPNGNLTCTPGMVCATATINFYGCLIVNVKTNTTGGSPLAIDTTQNSVKGPTHIFWVNNTNKNVVVKGYTPYQYWCQGKAT